MSEFRKHRRAIVLTCQNKNFAHAFQKELEIRQQKGYIDEDVLILTVEDPKSTVGSGGATLNALLVVAEHISAKENLTVVNSDVLLNSHILILHMGRNFALDSCGRAFVTLPAKYRKPKFDALLCNIDMLLDDLNNKIAQNSLPGVWVCNTDMTMTTYGPPDIDWSDDFSVLGIAIPSSQEYAKIHGVFKLDDQGYMSDIIFRGSEDAIAGCAGEDGMVPLVCGIVFFKAQIVEKLISFHTKPPLDACTYMGLDSGAQPLEMSLFFDFMLAMAKDVSFEAFVSGERSGRYGTAAPEKNVDEGQREIMRQARALLWKELQGIKVKTCLLKADHDYMWGLIGRDHHKRLLECPQRESTHPDVLYDNFIHSYIRSSVGSMQQLLNNNVPDMGSTDLSMVAVLWKNRTNIGDKAVIINSILEEGVHVGSRSVVSHSYLGNNIKISKDSLVAGVNLQDAEGIFGAELADNIVLQGYNIILKRMTGDSRHQHILAVWGKYDNIKAPMWRTTSTFCNVPWTKFLNRTGISKEDLWDADLLEDHRCIMTARLFPVFHAKRTVGWNEILWLQGKNVPDSKDTLKTWRTSWRLSLQEIVSCMNLSQEFQWRRELFFRVVQYEIKDILLGGKDKGLTKMIKSAVVEGFHSALLHTLDQVADECNDAGIAARAMANIADVLGCMAGSRGGLRSGPAANKAWAEAFQMLESDNIRGGVRALARQRKKWMDRSDLLIRAARHYEGAAQILIRHAVMTAERFIKVGSADMPEMEQWVIAECPARTDMAGGWSDTPPITYEHGGAVLNVAVLVDGKRPIGAKCRRIPEPELLLVLDGGIRLTLRDLSDLSDYSQPHAHAALLKAAFCCARVVQFPSDVSLHEQLSQRFGGGFELHTWSNLPRGSGLGTSSILAGAVLAVIWKTSGKSYDISSLNHAVLHIEQMMTTGGGWQDQVGGLIGGVKVGHSAAKLPVFIDAKILSVKEKTIQRFNEQFFLVYTGKTRLARNLLQNVIRNWYARDPDILETEDSLVDGAWECAKAFEDGDLEKVGQCMDRYWVLKRSMATGCEPAICRQMMDALRPYVHGTCMAGAGGGGFMYVLAKEPNSIENIREVLSKVEGTESVTVHTATVDPVGLSVKVLERDNREK